MQVLLIISVKGGCMSISQAYGIVMNAVIETNQDKAVKMYKKAIRLDPTSKLAYYHLGMIYAGRGIYSKAIVQYKNIITNIDPDDPGIWFLLSRVYHLDGQFDKAIQHYKKTYELDPLCDKACLYISAIYCQNKDKLLQALQYANKSIELRTPECMVDEDEFLANIKRVQLLIEQKENNSLDDDFESLKELRNDLSKASIQKLTSLNPDVIEIFMKHGIRCIGCAGYEDETVEEAAKENGSDLPSLLKSLDEAILPSI